MKAIIYHGSKADRAELRRKYMPREIGPKFPIVITSYEVVMNDAKFLSHYTWKYVVVDEVTLKLNFVLSSYMYSILIVSLASIVSC